MKYSLLINTYQVIRSIRYQILHSVFGVVSHCKHTPTCGTVFIYTTQKQGVLQGMKAGMIQLVRCM